MLLLPLKAHVEEGASSSLQILGHGLPQFWAMHLVVLLQEEEVM